MHPSERRRVWNTGKLLLAKFRADHCLMSAAALSFSSMLSIVPFLAILFAVLKALNVHKTLTPVILANVGAGSHELINRILQYIGNTRVGSMGAIGLVMLFVTIMATLDNVEDAFNHIWRLEQGKQVHHKVRDYLIVIFSIPLLITLTVTITTSLQHQGVVQWFFHLPGFGRLLLMLFRLVPYLSIWIALVCLYQFIPNTRVRVNCSLIGAVAAGTAWQAAQWFYIHFQFGVSRYNAIYGTMALLPVFMIWIYTGWVIVLAGMEIVWYLQNDTHSSKPHDTGNEGVKAAQTPIP
jgi:membrane protein